MGDVLDLDYVERLLDLRTSRLETIAASLRDIDAKKKGVNKEVRMVLCWEQRPLRCWVSVV